MVHRILNKLIPLDVDLVHGMLLKREFPRLSQLKKQTYIE